jgi:hypothetical protein
MRDFNAMTDAELIAAIHEMAITTRPNLADQLRAELSKGRNPMGYEMMELPAFQWQGLREFVTRERDAAQNRADNGDPAMRSYYRGAYGAAASALYYMDAVEATLAAPTEGA